MAGKFPKLSILPMLSGFGATKLVRAIVKNVVFVTRIASLSFNGEKQHEIVAETFIWLWLLCLSRCFHR
jgi:hypothetical protein